MNATPRHQITRTLTTVIMLSLGLSPLQAGNAVPTLLPAAHASQDDWSDDFSRLLDGLTALLMQVRQSADIATQVASVQALYRAGGIPPTIDKLEGQLLVATTYRLLKTDPGYLNDDLHASFAQDLRTMYRDLGGNPLLLW